MSNTTKNAISVIVYNVRGNALISKVRRGIYFYPLIKNEWFCLLNSGAFYRWLGLFNSVHRLSVKKASFTSTGQHWLGSVLVQWKCLLVKQSPLEKCLCQPVLKDNRSGDSPAPGSCWRSGMWKKALESVRLCVDIQADGEQRTWC